MVVRLLLVALVASLSSLCLVSVSSSPQASACIASAKGRGAGVPIQSCPDGKEQNGLLCYRPCKDGYVGRGPVCWKSCPNGTKEVGALCLKSYGKGCCCTKFGCCHNKCRDGYQDDGCTCSIKSMKSSYGRGTGSPLGCGKGKEENGGLCYNPCEDGYEGQGPVCWQQGVPRDFPHKCNAMLYAKDQSTCNQVNSDLAQVAGYTAACVALGIAVVGSGLSVLLPAAQALCGKSFASVVNEAQKVIQMTNAKTCQL